VLGLPVALATIASLHGDRKRQPSLLGASGRLIEESFACKSSGVIGEKPLGRRWHAWLALVHLHR
jgi:hypothetical protein